MIKTVLMGHFYEVYVKEGQTVKKGARIGLMGNTGVSDGEHLHLAVANSAQTNRWYLRESQARNVSKYDTEAFMNAGTLFAIDGNPHKYRITGGWLYYKNHYAYDMIADKAMTLPDIVWPLGVEGKVVQVHDDGDSQYGKVVLIQFGEKNTAQKTPEDLSSKFYKVKPNDSWW